MDNNPPGFTYLDHLAILPVSPEDTAAEHVPDGMESDGIVTAVLLEGGVWSYRLSILKSDFSGCVERWFHETRLERLRVHV